jgi:hypothetical protein
MAYGTGIYCVSNKHFFDVLSLCQSRNVRPNNKPIPNPLVGLSG